ncbi:MAG TPA: carbonic anhydrase [Gemmata sp.]|jgi:carbonic anhydrase|nr:carbonic anhydrase [Gemmata sp.]
MEWYIRYRRLGEDQLEAPATPEEAIRRLLKGNAEFVSKVVPDLPVSSTVGPPSAAPIVQPPKQAPYCIILGCSDARVPSEMLFGAGPNQQFVVRVAGNVLADECLGSIEYALHTFHESVHLLVVLGHTRCGAVTAAVDAYLRPTEHHSIAFTRSLRAVVNHALIAVRGAAVALSEVWGSKVADDPGYRDALIEMSTFLNAAMTAYHLRSELQPRKLFGVEVVYGVFDIASCRVIGPDLDPTTDDTSKLAPAPVDPDELTAIGRAIAIYPAVARYLTTTRRDD